MNKNTECAVVCDLIPLCADREASSESLEIVRKHISSCLKCHEYYRESGHIARSMKNPTAGNRYHYSKLADRLIKDNLNRLVGTMIIGAALGYVAGRLSEPSGHHGGQE